MERSQKIKIISIVGFSGISIMATFMFASIVSANSYTWVASLGVAGQGFGQCASQNISCNFSGSTGQIADCIIVDETSGVSYETYVCDSANVDSYFYEEGGTSCANPASTGLYWNQPYTCTYIPSAPNVPPVVNAGPDQTITVPTNSVILSGTATDSDGSIVSRSWTLVNGPLLHTIVSPTSPITFVNGINNVATYIFRFTATDNNGASSYDDVNVVVNPAPNIITASILSGSGTITSNTGLNCPGICSTPYSGWINVIATPPSSFISWSWPGSLACDGSTATSCWALVSGLQTVGANFTTTFTLTTAIDSGSGDIVSTFPAPVGLITCPGDCTESFISGTSVTITAAPRTGYDFSSWAAGDCFGQPSGCTVTMDGNRSASANFVVTPVFDYSLSNNGAMVSVTKSTVEVGSAPKTITKTLTSGTSQEVAITATGMPAGVTPAYDGNRSCSPNCSSAITFIVSPTATPGDYTINVNGVPAVTPTTFTLRIIAGAGISVSCDGDPDTALLGQSIIWTADASGGTGGPYRYEWTGDVPSPAPTTRFFNTSYSTIGTKSANVTVNDDVSPPANCIPDATVRINFNPSFEEF